MVDRLLDCDPNRLRRFLDEPTDEDDRAAVAAHLDDCETCRERIEALAAQEPWWADLRRFAPGGTRTGPPFPIGEIDAQDAPPDFLDPPDAEGFLGRFGPYQVIQVVDRGGMGVVLKAFDPALHRLVAIKVMAPQLAAGAAARQRFIREARAAASLAHDHVVTIHAVDESRGLPYLVMSYVAGPSLQERLDQSGPMLPREIVRVGMQIASGLAAAHAQGLVHRDIKPSNILLENGVERVKITDFGLSRSADDASLTQSGVVFGTPQYMSPEQARGEPVDHRADLFSLGCVMYAMAAGRSPFRAETTLAVLRRVCDDEPRPLGDVNPDVPAWLEAIVAKLLAKDPAERFRSAEEVAGLLERCLAHLQQPKHHALPDVPVPRPGVRKGGRRRAGARLLALALAGALAVFGVVVSRFETPEGTLVVEVDDPAVKVEIDGQDLVFRGVGPQELRLHPGYHRVTATQGGAGVLDELVTIVKDGKTAVRVRREPPAHGDAVAGLSRAGARPVASPAVPPAAAPPATPPVDPTAPAPDPALPKSLVFLREFQGHKAAVRGVAFLPGGLGALTTGLDGTMRIWDIRSGWELYQFGAEGHRPCALALLPGGRALTAGEDGAVVLWNLPGIREIRRFRGHEGAMKAVTPTADGHRFVSAGSDGTVRLWDLDSGEEVRRFEGHAGAALAVAVTNDGQRLLTAGSDGTVRLWDLATGRTVRIYEGGKGPVLSLAISPNGRHFVFGGEARLVCVGDLETGAVIGRLEGHTGPVTALVIAPDWRHTLSLSGDGTLRVWDLVALKPRGRTEVPGPARALAVATGSRLVLTGGDDSVARLWLVPLAPGEVGEPTPTEVVSPGTAPDAGARRPLDFLAPLLQDYVPTRTRTQSGPVPTPPHP
jgi:WD40 repeat protein